MLTFTHSHPTGMRRPPLLRLLLLPSLLLLLLLRPTSTDAAQAAALLPLQARARALLRHSVTAFFYLWYGVPEHDAGRYLHWDHFTLPHWTAAVNEQYQDSIRKHRSPTLGDIHAPFFPERGLYSSRDPAVLREQFREMCRHGMRLVAVSWWGQASADASADSQGVSTDSAVPVVLQAAEDVRQEAGCEDLHVVFHLEPYPGRSAASVKEDLAYIHTQYAPSPAFLPIYYVYDSYHISPSDWASLLAPDGAQTIRGTALDGVFIGLWLERAHGEDLVQGGFDGTYSYFASEGFSYGSTLAHWPHMVAFCRAQEKEFLSVLSIGPGYDDEKIRPWNAHNTKPRDGLRYLDRMFEAAHKAGPDAVSITSWNEWGEGTQVEPAKAGWRCEAEWVGNATHLPVRPYAYQEYEGGDPFLYVDRIQHWGERLWAEEEKEGRRREEL